MSSDVLYIPELAAKIGKTEVAVRAQVHRDAKVGTRKKVLPAPFKLGGKLAWRRADVDAWLERKAGATS